MTSGRQPKWEVLDYKAIGDGGNARKLVLQALPVAGRPACLHRPCGP